MTQTSSTTPPKESVNKEERQTPQSLRQAQSPRQKQNKMLLLFKAMREAK